MYKTSFYWNADDTDFTDVRRFCFENSFRILPKSSSENKNPSPDCNVNPFHFFFKNEKIVVESWK